MDDFGWKFMEAAVKNFPEKDVMFDRGLNWWRLSQLVMYNSYKEVLVRFEKSEPVGDIVHGDVQLVQRTPGKIWEDWASWWYCTYVVMYNLHI